MKPFRLKLLIIFSNNQKISYIEDKLNTKKKNNNEINKEERQY